MMIRLFAKKIQPGDIPSSIYVGNGLLPNREPKKVFISYRTDGGYFTAELLKVYLESQQIPTFLDVHDSEDDWKTKIENQIKLSQKIVIIVTPNMFGENKEDDVCKFEITLAVNEKKSIIPFVVNKDGANVPHNMGNNLERNEFLNNAMKNLEDHYRNSLLDKQCIFYSRDYAEESLKRLLDKVKE